MLSSSSASFNYASFDPNSEEYVTMNVDNRLRTQEERYASDHSTPYSAELADALNDLSQETFRDFERPIMMVPETQRKLYYQLVRMFRPNYILEIGTFTGATAIAMAGAFSPSSSSPSNGSAATASERKVVSLDIDAKCQEVARKYINKLEYQDRIELRLGPALESMKALKQEHPQRQYDFIFIDANKEDNIPYLNSILDNDLLADKGMIIVDDVLYRGYVHRLAGYDEKVPIPREQWNIWTNATHEFNQYVAQNPKLQVIMLPVFDGMSIITKSS